MKDKTAARRRVRPRLEHFFSVGRNLIGGSRLGTATHWVIRTLEAGAHPENCEMNRLSLRHTPGPLVKRHVLFAEIDSGPQVLPDGLSNSSKAAIFL